MSRSILRRCIGTATLTALCLLTACRSTPTHFYTLTPNNAAPAALMQGDRIAINVDFVHIPPQLNQPQLLVREPGQRVALVETERWISPLRDELRDALSQKLVGDLHALDAHSLPLGHAPDTYVVEVNVETFSGELDVGADLAATWSVKQGGHAWSCRTTGHFAAGTGYDGLVLAFQQAAATLGQTIARSIRSHAEGSGTSSCS